MALQAHFYKNFNKRINSTDIPTSQGDIINISLKENCSEHDPVVKVNTSELTYTYAYIEQFQKYYFVRDIVFIANNYFEFHLVEDVLATYRSTIRNSSFRLMYGPQSIMNKMLIDSRIQTLNSRVEYVFGGTGNNYRVFNDSSSAPHYIVTVMNYLQRDDGGFASSYYLDSAAMGDFKHWLMDDSVMEAIGRTISGEPLQAIISCKYVPYTIPSAYLESTTGILVARSGAIFEHSAGLYLIKGYPVIEKEIDIEYDTRYNGVSGQEVIKDFRAYPPYSFATIFLPGVGSVEINMADYCYVRKVIVRVSIEVITGNVRYELYNKLVSAAPVQTFTCNASSDIPIGQVSGSGQAVISGIVNTAVGAGTSAIGAVVGDLGTAVSSGLSTISGITNTILAFLRSAPSVIGSVGGRTVQLFPFVALRITTIDTEDPYAVSYIALHGTPTSGVHSLENLSGYIKCVDASIICSGSARERQEINDFLNGGFYLDLT